MKSLRIKSNERSIYFTPISNKVLTSNILESFHMRKSVIFSLLVICAIAISSCKKSPEYTPTPFACACGNLSWQDQPYELLGANYILADSTEPESRRYYVTADVSIEGETQAHGLSIWIEIPSLNGGGQFDINATLNEFEAWVDEYNLNDPIDTLRQFVPVNAVVQVSEAGLSGGTETVSFLLTLNELNNGVPIPGDVNCSGSFSLYINQ